MNVVKVNQSFEWDRTKLWNNDNVFTRYQKYTQTRFLQLYGVCLSAKNFTFIWFPNRGSSKLVHWFSTLHKSNKKGPEPPSETHRSKGISDRSRGKKDHQIRKHALYDTHFYAIYMPKILLYIKILRIYQVMNETLILFSGDANMIWLFEFTKWNDWNERICFVR